MYIFRVRRLSKTNAQKQPGHGFDFSVGLRKMKARTCMVTVSNNCVF